MEPKEKLSRDELILRLVAFRDPGLADAVRRLADSVWPIASQSDEAKPKLDDSQANKPPHPVGGPYIR